MSIPEGFDIWEEHDLILVSNRNVAQELQGHIDRLKPRFENDQLNTISYTKFMQTKDKIIKLEVAEALVQKTMDLYRWACNEGKKQRPASPVDTVPASESKYAVAIGVEGDLPVSPLRGVYFLKMILKDQWRIVVKLDPQETMGTSRMDAISVNF
ncbi:hypothetical protein Ptr902_12165 [Pyrenophora tritici-repentis]|nr:hypothetical protein Ptr902_12165 [Pyrenophora tritici-repentis]